MKQLDEVQEMNHQRRIRVFQDYHRYEQGQNQKDKIYHIHLKTRIEEHFKKDNKSHIFKHLHSSETCFDSYISLSFKIIDKANSKFDSKTKEDLHINWRKLNLNANQNHLALTLSLQFLPPCSFLSLFFFLRSSFIYYRNYLYANYQHLLLS